MGRAAGPCGRSAREPGQGLIAAAISDVGLAMDVLAALPTPRRRSDLALVPDHRKEAPRELHRTGSKIPVPRLR